MLVIVALLIAAAAGSARASCPTVELTAASPIAATRDVRHAHASYAEGTWGLGLSFGPDAGARLKAFTAAHVGQTVTLSIDGTMVRQLKILDPLKQDELWISPMSEADAKSLAERINACAGQNGGPA
jgi:preprotein translocase subunit SecD